MAGLREIAEGGQGGRKSGSWNFQSRKKNIAMI
jgi:hypothetical protein